MLHVEFEQMTFKKIVLFLQLKVIQIQKGGLPVLWRKLNILYNAFGDPGVLSIKRNTTICEEILKRGLEVSIRVYYRAHPVKGTSEDIGLYKLYNRAGYEKFE